MSAACSETTHRRLTVVVVVPGSTVAAWQKDCIEALQAHGELLSVRVVRANTVSWKPPRGVVARLAGSSLAPATVSAESGGLQPADLIVNLTSTELREEPPLGVWRFRLDGSDDVGFPFAPEIARGARTIEIALLRARAKTCEVLASGRFEVTVWYPATLRSALRIAARWPATLAAALAAGIELDARPAQAGPPCRPLGALGRAAFVGSMAARFGRWILRQLFYTERWELGVLSQTTEQVLAGEALHVRWLHRPKDAGFNADPFPVVRDGRRAVFYENYDEKRGRGVVDAALLDDSGRIVRRGRAIERTNHLSYPYPFVAGGELFLVLENYASNEVPLYRCSEFPWRWEPQPPIMTGIDAVDTTLFEHEGRWWAFCTRHSQGPMLALFAFYAPSFRGPWSPHALNPIVVDVASARPAGRPFRIGGTLYRPGQDCSRTYGGGLVIARVDALTPTAYRETIVRRIDATALRPPTAGVHTLNGAEGLCFIDGKVERFTPLRCWTRAPQLARQLAGRLIRLRAAQGPESRPLRVVHVCAQLGSYGAENVVTKLLQHTREPDAVLQAITVNRWAHPEIRRTLDFPVVEIDRRGRFDLPFIWRLVTELRRLKPDVVHTHAHAGRYWGRLAAVLARVPLIVHTEHNSELKPPPPRSFFNALNHWLRPRTSAFVTFNQVRRAALAAAEDIPLERIAVIPNGTPLAQPDPLARERVRRELRLSQDELAIFLISRLSEEKRPDLALEAVAALPAPWCERVRLFVLGDGPLRERLERQAQQLGLAERVRFLGFVPDGRGMLAGADALLLTSAREAMPLALIEAMVERVPVVSVPWNGAETMLEGGRFGTLAAGYDPRDVASALAAVFADPAGTRERAEAAFEHARVEYDVTTQARRYAELYRALAAERRETSKRIAAARS